MNKLRGSIYCFVFAGMILPCDQPKVTSDDIQKIEIDVYAVLMQKRKELKAERLPVFIDEKSLKSGTLEFYELMSFDRAIADVDKELNRIRVNQINDKK